MVGFLFLKPNDRGFHFNFSVDYNFHSISKQNNSCKSS